MIAVRREALAARPLWLWRPSLRDVFQRRFRKPFSALHLVARRSTLRWRCEFCRARLFVIG